MKDLREHYEKGGLLESDTPADPLLLFDRWFRDAVGAGIPDANAMALATASASAQPSLRMVLLKGVDDRGFAFFTNYSSRKAVELASNPLCSLLFFWNVLERQVRIEGVTAKLPRAESEDYFRTRPAGSKLGAWASAQSSVIDSRGDLETEMVRLAGQFGGGDIPCPPFWGGYVVSPLVIEFWQGRPNRLHDRIRYTRRGEAWVKERLAP